MITVIATFLKTYIVGIVGASISTTFALYMFINGQEKEDLPNVVVAHVPVMNPLDSKLTTASVPRRPKFTNSIMLPQSVRRTSSISKQLNSGTNVSVKQDMLKIGRLPPQDPQSLYILRLATGDMALLEGNGKLWSVQPGHILPGTGRVLQIKKNGAKWVVVTTNGEISE